MCASDNSDDAMYRLVTYSRNVDIHSSYHQVNL